MDPQMQISEGMTVVGAEGDKVGKIAKVEADHVVVEKGFFFPTDYYIPTSAITSTDGDNAYLSMSKDEALNQETWTSPPSGDTYAETAPVAAMDATDAAPSAYQRDSARTQDSEAIRVPVYEEDLTATKREVDRGAVTITKDIVSEERTIDVPVTEERVRVSRVAADPNATYDSGHAFEDGVIEVPVRGQEVDLAKSSHLAGEVVVEKEAVQRTERVGGTVRREEVRVDDQSVDATTDVAAEPTSSKSNRSSRSERRRNR